MTIQLNKQSMRDEAYWENLVKRSLCRFLLLGQLAKGPVHGYQLNLAIRDACQGCCEPTEAMVYSTMKELVEGGYVVDVAHRLLASRPYVVYRMEEHLGRKRRVCWLTDEGKEAFRAAGRVWQKMLPTVEETVAQALGTQDDVPIGRQN